MVNGIAAQPVGVVYLASLVLSENGMPCGGRVVKQPVIGSRSKQRIIVLLYAFLRAIPKNETSFKTACASSMFQR